MDDSIQTNSDATQIEAQTGTLNVPYHKHGGSDGPLIPLQNISGNFPMVTTTPTFNPTGGVQTSIALNTNTEEIFYYDFTNKEWRSVSSISNLSAVSPILFDPATGVISFAGLNQISESFTAAESISAGNAVSIGPYQSDGGITYDTSASATVTTSAGGGVTIGFSVGSNSNRVVVIHIISISSSGVTATYAGLSMTPAFSQQAIGATGEYIYAFYIVAPTVGSNNFVFAGMGNAETVNYAAYSYYNVAQTGTIAQAPINTASSTNTVSQTVTPNNSGSLLLSVVGVNIGSGSPTYTQVNMNNNVQAPPRNNPTNTTIFTGDSGDVPNAAALTVSSTSSSGGLSWVLATIEVKPFTAVTYRVFKSNTTTVGWNTNWKLNSFIGFSTAAYSLGNSAAITIGGTNSNQSSLQPSAQYYIGSSGAIATTGTRKVGIATSATEILLTNVW